MLPWKPLVTSIALSGDISTSPHSGKSSTMPPISRRTRSPCVTLLRWPGGIGDLVEITLATAPSAEDADFLPRAGPTAFAPSRDQNSPVAPDGRWHCATPAGFGSPMQLRFQGKGLVGGEEWVYDYVGWLVPAWPSSTDVLERAAIVESVIRTVPHSNGQGGISPAGVVCSFYAASQICLSASRATRLSYARILLLIGRLSSCTTARFGVGQRLISGDGVPLLAYVRNC